MLSEVIIVLLAKLNRLEDKVSELLQRPVCKHHHCGQHNPPKSTPATCTSNNITPIHDISPVTEKNVPGMVKWFNIQKGFGFITRTDTIKQEDVFVHKSGISKRNPAHKTLSLGQAEHVVFDIIHVSGRSSPEAINVSGPNNANVMGSSRRNCMESHSTAPAHMDTPSSCASSVIPSHRPSPTTTCTVNQDSKPVIRRRRLLPKLPKTSKSSHRERTHTSRTHERVVSHRPEPTPSTRLSQTANSIHGSDSDMCYDTTD